MNTLRFFLKLSVDFAPEKALESDHSKIIIKL